MNQAPLIIHHEGYQPYLSFCLWQNRRTNPDRPIILLGDEVSRIRGIEYRHELIADYQTKNRIFIEKYRHVTRSDYVKERRHLERWFVLSTFLEQAEIKAFYFIDSDYLLFSNLTEHESAWSSCGLMGTPSFWGLSFHESTFHIHHFCDWLLGLYADTQRFEVLLKQQHEMNGHLQEMGFINEYCAEQRVLIQKMDWRNSGKNNSFDDYIFGSSYFSDRDEFMKLRQEVPGGPVTLHHNGGHGTRRLLGLHFQGHSKRQIPGFTGWCRPVWNSFFRPNYRRNLKHLFQYVWEGRRCRRLLQRPWSQES